MRLFKCCRSNQAVDQYAHISSNKEAFNEDVKAVKWIRDRNLSTDLKIATTSDNELSSSPTREDPAEEPSLESSRPSSDQSELPRSDCESILKDLLNTSKQEDHTEKSSKRQKRDELRKKAQEQLDSFKEKSLSSGIKLKESPKDSKRRSRDTRKLSNRELEKRTMEQPIQANPEKQSDVDSLTPQERYKLAVELLHKRLIEKKKKLSPSEKQFLNFLSQSNPETDESGIEEKISVIESTIENLNETDSLFPRESNLDDNVSVYSVTSEGHGMEVSLAGARKRTIKQKKLDQKTPCEETDQNKDAILEEDEELDEVDDSPFPILGVSDNNADGLLRTRLMEALRGFLPYAVSEENFWLKYRMSRNGSSLLTLQESIRASQFTLLVIKAKGEDDCIFGCFTSSPWRRSTKWFGSGQSFLFKYSKGELGVYPFTDSDELVQYCTTEMMAAGGGDWKKDGSPFGKGQKNGIGLLLDKNLVKGETYSCATFCNPRLCSKADNEFTIDDIEAWSLTPCMTENEAANLERHKLFVEKNRC